MSSISRRIFVLAATILALGLSAYAGPGPKAIQWQTDLKKAQTAAAKQKKLIMMDFYAEW
jgi:thiol:disulfide interchange protein